MKLEAGEVREVREVGRTHIIKRPRLTRLLDETDARIILLIAPAGYGKTTLAREWLADRPHGWYRGSPASGDVAALALGLARAASRLVPKADERLRARLQLSRAPMEEVEDLAHVLAEDLSAWPEGAWLAFDDYQFACDSESAERLLDNLAFECQIQLLIASRTRPRWASARRTLYGEVFEVGRNLLAMRTDEAELVLSSRSREVAEGLLPLAEGWPALIALTNVAARTDMPAEVVPEDLYAFFAEELYLAARPDVQQGLRRLALAPYVTTDIAEAVLEDNADEVIAHGLELGFFSSHRERIEFHP